MSYIIMCMLHSLHDVLFFPTVCCTILLVAFMSIPIAVVVLGKCPSTCYLQDSQILSHDLNLCQEKQEPIDTEYYLGKLYADAKMQDPRTSINILYDM